MLVPLDPVTGLRKDPKRYSAAEKKDMKERLEKNVRDKNARKSK
ncbi:MAG: hypothetical protein V3R57_05250 [Candidatus Bathyarchaeia archaeon]